MTPPPLDESPRISPWLLRAFTGYSRRYLRRHFHGMRVLSRPDISSCEGRPLVIYTNHSSWWDPLVGLILKDRFFPHRPLYSPIDSEALKKYGLFRRLGFFGVERGTRRGAAAFLGETRRLLDDPRSVIAVTPQGRFADVRERPAGFEAGLGHLARRHPQAIFMAVAVEYVFWDERLPEVLSTFGPPRTGAGLSHDSSSPRDVTVYMERELESLQDTLSQAARTRDVARFESVLDGGVGQGGVYDLWRSLKARLKGETFNPEHARS